MLSKQQLNAGKLVEISTADDLNATLIASGFSAEQARSLTAFMDTEGAINLEELISSRRLEITETLSLYWLVRELRNRITTYGTEPAVAMDALKLLVTIAMNRELFKP